MCSILEIIVCPFDLYLFAIVLSVLLRFMDSDFFFGISKLFLNILKMCDLIVN